VPGIFVRQEPLGEPVPVIFDSPHSGADYPDDFLYACTPKLLRQAEDAHAVLRMRFAQIFGEDAANRVSIQYGGSVVPEDAAALLSRPGIDGALLGGASLVANEFLAVVRAALAETRSVMQSA